MSTNLVFLLACLFILLLVAAMFLILKSTVSKINSQSKNYFVDKLQQYDHLIDEKENQLSRIDKEIKDKELKTEETNNSIHKDNYDFDYKMINLLNETKYQDTNVFELNKKLENSFNIDYNEIINKFLNNELDEDNYLFCVNLRNKFDSDTIYKLKTLTNKEMEEDLKVILEHKEYRIYEIYKSLNKKISIDGFIDYINELVDNNNPYITIYVGNKNENYDNLSKYIKTIYSSDIYKGIKIVYKNKIYDYSLNERNV